MSQSAGLTLLLAGLLALASVPSAARAQAAIDPDDPDRADAEDVELGRLSYDPQGRRDPFRPLTGEAPAEEERSEYVGQLRGLLWDQAKLTAILKTPSGPVAMFEGGPTREGYPARIGDQFWDAFVFDIDYEAGVVTIRQELDDPRLLKPYRDHVVPLNPNNPNETPAALALRRGMQR